MSVSGKHHCIGALDWTYLVPGPDGFERVDERDVLPQVRKQPQSRRDDKVGDAEEDDTEYGHEEEQSQQTQEAPAEIVDTLAHLEWPQWVEDNDENGQEGKEGIDLSLDLASLVHPDVVHIVASVLLRHNAHRPETLDALCSLGRVGVTGMGIGFLDSEGQHGHGQELECILEGRSVGDLG